MIPEASVPGAFEYMIDLTIFERYRDVVDDWQAFAEALARPLAPVVWANTLRTTAERFRERLAEAGLAAEHLAWHPGAFRLPLGTRPGKSLAFLTGQYHVQEEVSLLPVVLLDPRPGERILDLCAAPGNKTVQAAVRMGDRGAVIANDKSRRRLGVVRRNLERLGVTCVAVTVADGASLPRSWGLFDRVLADVPCTCEGTTRRNPEVAWRWQLSPLDQSKKQLPLLDKAVQHTRPGGRVVYSTCTYAPEENEAVVDAALRRYGSELRLLPAEIPGFRSAPGLTAWRDRRWDGSLERAMRVFPHHNDSGGFFVAMLERAPFSDAAGDS
jgi:NOL1/NOP2/sun family putative RNA methylase